MIEGEVQGDVASGRALTPRQIRWEIVVVFAVSLGASGLIHKPIDGPALVKEVERWTR